MNYSEMSDFEINCAVARALGMAHAFFFSKSEDDFCEGIEPNQRGPIWQSKEYLVNGYRVSNGNCFNPCNSWADAGPIIEKQRITIAYDGEEKSDHPCAWVNVSSIDNLHAIKYQHTEKTLRAAMIIFLMMQEKPDAA